MYSKKLLSPDWSSFMAHWPIAINILESQLFYVIYVQRLCRLVSFTNPMERAIEEGRAARRDERRTAQEVLCAAAETRREERGERRDERSARRDARPRRRRSRETRETRCGYGSRRDETRAAAAAAREREHAEKKSRVQREEQEREREKESEPCA